VSHLDITPFARSNFRHRDTSVGIRLVDRLSHIYVVGKTGVGKSTLLKTFALQDMVSARGFAVIDPHGELAEELIAAVPFDKRDKFIYLNAPDPDQPYGYNPLRRVRDDKIPLAVSGLLETLRKLWPDAWGVRMEHVLRNSLYALLERDGSCLPDILRLYVDDDFRTAVTNDVRNETVRNFWSMEFENYPARLRAEVVAPIQNKLGALLSDPVLYRVLVAPKIDIHFRRLMDDGGALIVNVSKGHLGEDSAQLLGGLIASTIGLAAFSRAESGARRPFFLYMDEFQNFTTLMLANMMSELRKYGVGLVLAHQYLHQLEPEILHAVLGNAATLICFRVGAADAATLTKELTPIFVAQDLTTLPNHNMLLKLMIDGTPSVPFSARSLNSDVAMPFRNELVGCDPRPEP